MNKLMGMFIIAIVSTLLHGCKQHKINSSQSYIKINKLDKDNRSLLCYAVSGNINKLTQLLKSFPKDHRLHSIPINKNSKQELIKLLLQFEADPNIKTYNNWQPLHYACHNGDVEVVKLLIDAGAKLNSQIKNGGGTPLHIACQVGNEKVVEIMIRAGANIEAKYEDYSTPLHWACTKNHYKIVKLLILAGADIQARTKNGATPLHWTITHWRGKSTKLLIDAGANVNAKDHSGKTPQESFIDSITPRLRSTSEFPNIY